jgi:hypothetical protein
MKTDFWLIVSANGSTYTRKTKPDLSRSEVAVKLSLSLPDALFERPHLSADITIDPENVTTFPLDSQVVQGVKDAVKQSTGVDLNIRIVDPHHE